VLVEYPFSDLQASKVRPALVVSNDEVNRSEDCIVVSITSVNRPFSIPIADDDLSDGILYRQSFVRTDHINTISQAVIKTRIGALSQEAFDRIKTEILRAF
jgi:mRNA-degrading endonuclease toxin of MazEF toxin-antitoxin module